MKKGVRRDNSRDTLPEPKRRSAAQEHFYVALNARDKAPELVLSKDQLSVSNGEGGYRMVRATHGVHNGSYFYEVLVHEARGENAHLRLGWSTRQGNLQAPCGYDKWSFGYRDIAGSKIHNRIRDDKYGSPYGAGDVIGCFLHLDDQDPENNQMRFFKNGVDQGIAYQGKEIENGVYFPAVSLYMQVRASPDW